MNGNIEVTYKVVNQNDLNVSISLEELLKNEKVVKTIKAEFAKGYRNIEVKNDENKEGAIKVETFKEHHSFSVLKDDFADIVTLAEDNATTKKLLKKECFVELVDIQTVE